MKRKVNQLKAGAMLSYVQMGISNVIGILYTPIMIRLLGQSEYGLYNLVSSVVSYLGLLSFGFGSAYVRYYTKAKNSDDEKALGRINGMFITIYSVIAVIALVAGIILCLNVDIVFGSGLTPNEKSRAQILMAFLVFTLSLSFPMSVFVSYIMANERFVFQRVITMISTIVSPMIALPIMLAGYKSIGLVVTSTVLAMVTHCVNVYFCVKKLKMKFYFKEFNFSILKEMFTFSFFIFINMIVDQINWTVDKYIVGRFVGTAGVAIYSVGASLNNYFLSFSTSISGVFAPKIHRIANAEHENIPGLFTNLMIKVGRIQFMILSLVLSGFIFFGKYFILDFFAGKGYENSYWVAILLMAPAIVPLIQNIGIEIQRAMNLHKSRSIIYIFIALGNLLISIPLCKRYGEIGSALGTAVALVIGNVFIMNLYYHFKMKIDMKKFWFSILKFIPALIAPIVFGILCLKFITITNLFVFGGLVIAYTAIFCGSMWLFGMNASEKNLVKKPLTVVLRKLRLIK